MQAAAGLGPAWDGGQLQKQEYRLLYFVVFSNFDIDIHNILRRRLKLGHLSRKPEWPEGKWWNVTWNCYELWSGIMRRRCAARSSDNVYNVYLRKRSSDNISTPPPASALAREAAARLSRPFPRLLVKTWRLLSTSTLKMYNYYHEKWVPTKMRLSAGPTDYIVSCLSTIAVYV